MSSSVVVVGGANVDAACVDDAPGLLNLPKALLPLLLQPIMLLPRATARKPASRTSLSSSHDLSAIPFFIFNVSKVCAEKQYLIKWSNRKRNY